MWYPPVMATAPVPVIRSPDDVRRERYAAMEAFFGACGIEPGDLDTPADVPAADAEAWAASNATTAPWDR